MTGFLGEVAFEKTFKQFDYVGDKSYTHDYEYKGLKVDVKAKSCNCLLYTSDAADEP